MQGLKHLATFFIFNNLAFCRIVEVAIVGHKIESLLELYRIVFGVKGYKYSRFFLIFPCSFYIGTVFLESRESWGYGGRSAN